MRRVARCGTVGVVRVRGDGNGFVRCADGQWRWGRFGAAGLLLRAPDPSDHAVPLVLLQHRALWTHQGGRWGLPGGARDSFESAADTALREAAEETGIDPGRVRVCGQHTDHPGGDGWSYTTVVADAPEPLPLWPQFESADLQWVPEADVSGYELHPGFGATWPSLRIRSGELVVDGANAIGSRPDGWWRDRPAATERLLRQLVAARVRTLPLPGGEFGWVRRCVVVLEGQAATVPDVRGVDVVRAAGSGDDAVAAAAADEPDCFVVTADRGLRARLPAASAVLGPAALLERIGEQRHQSFRGSR